MRMTARNLTKSPSRVIDVVELDNEVNRVSAVPPFNSISKPLKPSSDSKYVQGSGETFDVDEGLEDSLKKRADDEMVEEARCRADNTFDASSAPDSPGKVYKGKKARVARSSTNHKTRSLNMKNKRSPSPNVGSSPGPVSVSLICLLRFVPVPVTTLLDLSSDAVRADRRIWLGRCFFMLDRWVSPFPSCLLLSLGGPSVQNFTFYLYLSAREF